MITTKTMFELYDAETSLRLEELKKTINALSILNTKYLVWFKNNSLSILDKEFEKEPYLTFKAQTIQYPLKSVESYYNVQLRDFYINQKELNRIKSIKEGIESTRMNEKTFTLILIKFNTKVVDAIINEDYEFNNVVTGKVTKHINKQPKDPVDWVESYKVKVEIEAKGQIPAFAKDRLEAEKRGEVYEGIEWIRFKSPYRWYMNWSYSYAQTISLCNIKNFIFIPYRGENSTASKMNDYNKTFTEDQLINLYNQRKNAN